MMFVKPHIRKSLMAKMVSELLDTRAMVKTSMKAVSDDRVRTELPCLLLRSADALRPPAGADEAPQRAAARSKAAG